LEIVFLKADNDSLSDDLFIMQKMNELIKPGKLDNFEVGLAVGIILVVATGMVLKEAWD